MHTAWVMEEREVSSQNQFQVLEENSGEIITGITIKWTKRWRLDEAMSAWEATKWHGLYCISKERGGTPERPVYIGISNAEKNTISNRLKDHKQSKLSSTQGPYFVRFGQVQNQLQYTTYADVLVIAESALISYLMRNGYKLKNKQVKRKIAQDFPIYIYNVGDLFFFLQRLSSNIQL